MFKIYFFLLLNFLIFSYQIQSQNLTAEDIVKEYLVKSGGEENLKNIFSYKVKKKVTLSEYTNQNSYYESYAKKENLHRTDNIKTKTSSIYDGFDIWVKKESGKYKKININIAGKFSFYQNIAALRILHYIDEGYTLELLGSEKVRDEEYYKIKLSRKDEKDIIAFFSKKSYLLKKLILGDNLIYSYKDYRKVDEFLLPFYVENVTQSYITATTITQILEIQLNPDLPVDIFEIPKENIEEEDE